MLEIFGFFAMLALGIFMVFGGGCLAWMHYILRVSNKYDRAIWIGVGITLIGIALIAIAASHSPISIDFSVSTDARQQEPTND